MSSSTPSEISLAPTHLLKLVGRNIKVPVRSAPNAQGTIIRFLNPGDIIEVKVMDSKGFYRLADESVQFLYTCFYRFKILSLFYLTFSNLHLKNIGIH